jgi:PAS domain S-box-containing protein
VVQPSAPFGEIRLTSTKEELAESLIAHLAEISAGRCSISEEGILEEKDGTLQEILSGLLCLHENLEFREKRLLAEQRRFRSIFEHIPVMLAVHDARRGTPLINPALERTLGWSADEWTEHSPLPCRAHRAPAPRQERNEVVSAEPRWFDVNIATKSSHTIETRWADISLPGGELICVGEDISQQKELEREQKKAVELALAASKSKSDFVANMSHELRTPLNGVIGMCQLLQTTTLDEEQQEYVDTQQTSAGLLLELINNVLDFSLIESG